MATYTAEQIAAMDQATKFAYAKALFSRVYREARYQDLAGIVKHINGGASWGFNSQELFSRQARETGQRLKFCAVKYLLNNYPLEKIEDALDDHARRQTPDNPQAQRRTRNRTRTPAQAQPQAVRVDSNIPAPDTDDETQQEAMQAATQAAPMQPGVDESRVRQIARQEAERAVMGVTSPTVVHITTEVSGETVTTDAGLQHKLFPTLLRMIQIGYPVWIPGPAGSGKTTAVNNACKALDASLHMPPEGPIENKYGFIGFNDAKGEFNATTLYNACKEASENPDKRVIYFIDECDSGYANALLVLNAVMENGYCTFANGERIHFGRNLQFIAGANTYGAGATHEYVGRNKLDGATLDRFVMLPWDYDEELERAIAGNAEWVATVQKIRKALYECNGIKHIVSPRASIRGAAYLAAGFTRKEVAQWTVFKGLSSEQVRQVCTRASMFDLI